MSIKTIKVKPTFTYDFYKFEGDTKELTEFLEKNSNHFLEVIDIREGRDEWDKVKTYNIFYLSYGEPKQLELKEGHYVWLDEVGLVNSCIESYFLENYEVIHEGGI